MWAFVKLYKKLCEKVIFYFMFLAAFLSTITWNVPKDAYKQDVLSVQTFLHLGISESLLSPFVSYQSAYWIVHCFSDKINWKGDD